MERILTHPNRPMLEADLGGDRINISVINLRQIKYYLKTMKTTDERIKELADRTIQLGSRVSACICSESRSVYFKL